MRNTQNITIAMLCVTASILVTALVLVNGTTPAYGEIGATRGDYIWINGAVSNGTDYVYVVDRALQMLNVYRIDAIQNKIIIADQVPLKNAFDKP